MFLTIVFALALLQVWGSATPVHRDDWFLRLREVVAGWSLPPAVELAVVILVPAGLVYWLFDWLEGFLFGLPWLAGAIVVLLYSFGRGDFRQLCNEFGAFARRGDTEAAFLHAQETLDLGLEGEVAGSADEVNRSLERSLLYEGCQRLFAVLFFFALLGPAGALAYRLLHLCRDSAARELVERALFLLDWVPARLLAVAFTVTGDFIGSREALIDVLVEVDLPAGLVLQQVAERAEHSAELEAGDRIAAYSALLSRSTAAWVVMLALYVVLT